MELKKFSKEKKKKSQAQGFKDSRIKEIGHLKQKKKDISTSEPKQRQKRDRRGQSKAAFIYNRC